MTARALDLLVILLLGMGFGYTGGWVAAVAWVTGFGAGSIYGHRVGWFAGYRSAGGKAEEHGP